MQQAVIEKLKVFIKSEKGSRIIVFMGLAGLLCILLSSWLAPDGEEKPAAETERSVSEHQDAEQYVDTLERRLEDMLMKTEGVGRCRVMITVSGSPSYSYAQDAEQYADEDSQEIKRRHVILDEETGDGALVEYTENPEVVGVIIACEGGGNNVVREQIYKAAGAVLDISSDRICVTKLIEESEE